MHVALFVLNGTIIIFRKGIRFDTVDELTKLSIGKRCFNRNTYCHDSFWYFAAFFVELYAHQRRLTVVHQEISMY